MKGAVGLARSRLSDLLDGGVDVKQMWFENTHKKGIMKGAVDGVGSRDWVIC